MYGRRLTWIAWPAFLVAGVLEAMVFAVLDPETLTLLGRQVDWSRYTVYSVTFLIFWCMFMLCSAMTLQLADSSAQVNARLHRPDLPE
ncbi:MAG: hypothetical protein WBG44_02525 [Comamonas sp.]|jgi:hypothetical protein|nr:hypothetical protein [Comamonas sp.]